MTDPSLCFEVDSLTHCRWFTRGWGVEKHRFCLQQYPGVILLPLSVGSVPSVSDTHRGPSHAEGVYNR